MQNFEIFQKMGDYLVNPKILGGRGPPWPPPTKEAPEMPSTNVLSFYSLLVLPSLTFYKQIYDMSTSAGWNPLTAGCSTKLCCTNNNNKRELLPNQANLVFYSILLRKEREDFLCNVEPTRTSLVVIRVLKVTSRTQMKECVCVSRVFRRGGTKELLQRNRQKIKLAF